ncbi:MAG TPA: [protein-PII] uridylyltransferase, partial [Euzebya sp.]|nr:[protein-PII] uridylyltransferase [Euzebya sp.]
SRVPTRSDPYHPTMGLGLAGGDMPSVVLDHSVVEAAPGRPWSLQWTAMVDAGLQAHLRAFQASAGQRSGGIALIALGSYARRSLCPRSDIDLLLVHDGWSSSDLEALVQAVCYPLWDAGLSVGHAVRTTKEAIKAAGDRVDTATALTERRLVAGSRGLADDLSARVIRWLRRSGARFAEEIVAADAERHRRYGGSPGALEPELKDGIGGLRDLHSLRWAGAILLGEPGLDPLVGARYLGADDRAALAGAGERLLAARCALHQVGGKGVHDQLRLDLQDEVAGVLGMADGDVLLREVGLATRTIAHLHARSWPVLLEEAIRGRRRRRPSPVALAAGLSLLDGLVEVDADAHLEDDPSLGMRAVAAAAEHGTVLGRRSAMRLRREVESLGSLPWDERSRAGLLQVLRGGHRGMAAMGDADYLGLLDAYLPEWQRVRGRPQRNPLHTFDLDTHALQAVAWLADVVAGHIDPRHIDIHAGLEDPDGLVLGTWLHDVGKAWPGDHSVAGETVGGEWAMHMGFSAERAERVARLIRHHLLLPDVATQRDIDDPDEVERVAVTVGDTETLDGLYLLSFADSRATGKAAWSDWKDLLLRRLYESARAVLQGDVGILDRPETPDVVVRAAVRLGGEEAHLRQTIDGLPDRYLHNVTAEQLAVHGGLLKQGATGLVADVRSGPVPSTQVLSIVAPDRHGLFVALVGVLATHRVEVREARVFTNQGGTALDWFVVSAPPEVRWDSVIADLASAAVEDLDVGAAVDRRERQRDVRPPVLAHPVPISISATVNAGVTRVEVRGPDSPGALFRIATVLSDLGTELLGAQLATLGPEVHDTFFIRGRLPPADGLRAALESALLDTPAVLAGPRSASEDVP